MMKYFIHLLFLFCLLSGSAIAQPKTFVVHKGMVGFESRAPLEVIKAASTSLTGNLDPVKRTFTFIIPNTSFVGFNNPLQQIHFYENYMEADKYPDSRFVGKIIEQVNFRDDGIYDVRAKGILTLHGVDQERILKVKIRLNKGALIATSEFSVLLKEYNISIPRVVHQKIAEEIFISVHAEMTGK
jgi:polyisoprenoid-binding protein YceI